MKWRKINCCGTVRLIRKGMPEDLRCKTVKLRWGDIQYSAWARVTSACWLTFMIHPQKGNFLCEQGNMIKPDIMASCNRHMEYVDKGNRMADSYSVSCQTWKCMRGLFSYLFSLAILNSCILLSSCGGKKISHMLESPFCGTCWQWLDKNSSWRGL